MPLTVQDAEQNNAGVQVMSFFTLNWSELSSSQQTPVAISTHGLRGAANIHSAFACLAFFSLPICVIATFVWVPVQPTYADDGALLVDAETRSSENSNWITSPQVCVGKAYSNTAKAANWRLDKEHRVLLAAPESGEMLTSFLPGANADFVAWIRMRLAEDSQCRLTVGEETYDVSNSGEQTRLVTAGSEYSFDRDAKSLEWMTLRVERRDDKVSVQVNQQPEVDLGNNANAVEKISLQSIRGTIGCSHFVVTGNVRRVNQAQVAPNNAGLQIWRACVSEFDEPENDKLNTFAWKFGDGKTKSVLIDVEQSPLISESDILGVEACAPLILQLTQAARKRIADAMVRPTEQGAPIPLLAVTLHGELIGVEESDRASKDEKRLTNYFTISPEAVTRLREYVTPSLVNYHCQGVHETAPDKSFFVSTKLFAVEDSTSGKPELVIQYRISHPRDKEIRVELTLDGKTERRTLKRDEGIDMPVVNDPLAGRYKADTTIVANGDHFDIESTLTRSLDGVAAKEEFKTPVVAVRLLLDAGDTDDGNQSGDPTKQQPNPK